MPKYSTSSSMMAVDCTIERESEVVDEEGEILCVGGGKNENGGWLGVTLKAVLYRLAIINPGPAYHPFTDTFRVSIPRGPKTLTVSAYKLTYY